MSKNKTMSFLFAVFYGLRCKHQEGKAKNLKAITETDHLLFLALIICMLEARLHVKKQKYWGELIRKYEQFKTPDIK